MSSGRTPLVALTDVLMTKYCVDDVVRYIDSYLGIRDVPDDPRALNGLQVENSGRLDRIAAAVDACQATIDDASARGAGLLLVHHGLFWSGPEPLTGRHGRRVRTLHRHDLALYAAHLPLDCHPEVGNNAVLARGIGLEDPSPFGLEGGVRIGLVGRLRASRAQLAQSLTKLLGAEPRLVAAGPTQTERVAVVSGAGASFLREARDIGADTLITGEGPHHIYFDAEEWGLNLVLAGHYATETVGVKALAAHVSQRCDIPWDFVDHPTGL